MADAKVQNLDGSAPIKAVPFDAHEKATRGEHVPTGPDSPDRDPALVQEFPKAVDHVDHPSGVGKQPVIANSPEEEAALLAAKSQPEAAESADEDAEEEETGGDDTGEDETLA